MFAALVLTLWKVVDTVVEEHCRVSGEAGEQLLSVVSPCNVPTVKLRRCKKTSNKCIN